MALYSEYEYVIRQRLSRMFDDCVTCTVSAGAASTATLATTDPPQFYGVAADYFNEHQYEVYCYSGTNIGATRLANDFASYVITVIPDAASAYDTTSLLELH